MCIYEKTLMERLKSKEEGMRAEIARLEKLMETKLTKYKENIETQSGQIRLQLEMYQTREKMYQFREKIYQAALVLVILLMLFYVSGYNNTNSGRSKLMLT
jgi:ABC-type phosphate transport system permease subunit